jgi:hypothetical protein
MQHECSPLIQAHMPLHDGCGALRLGTFQISPRLFALPWGPPFRSPSRRPMVPDCAPCRRRSVRPARPSGCSASRNASARQPAERPVPGRWGRPGIRTGATCPRRWTRRAAPSIAPVGGGGSDGRSGALPLDPTRGRRPLDSRQGRALGTRSLPGTRGRRVVWPELADSEMAAFGH